eukprot:COSAG06_NODE_12479_length_1375_cov_61.966079_1_plen_94_part_00
MNCYYFLHIIDSCNQMNYSLTLPRAACVYIYIYLHMTAIYNHRGVSMVFIIGGDGTHRGAQKLHLACAAAAENLAVVGIPKTIDNDIGTILRI